jgi:hypothetical protein
VPPISGEKKFVRSVAIVWFGGGGVQTVPTDAAAIWVISKMSGENLRGT